MRRPYIDPSEQSLLRTLGLPGAGSGVRASDAERERAADALRRHHADGRLTTDELEERTERAYAATTLGELDRLFNDLPRAPVAEHGRRRPAWPPPMPIAILAVLAVIAVVTSAHAVWIAWPLMFVLFLRLTRRGSAWRSHGWPEH